MSKAADYIEQLEHERDSIAAQNVALKAALQDCVDMPKAHAPIRRAVLLLNLHNLAESVLKRRDAEVLRQAADRFEAVDPHPKHWDWLRRNAAEIEGELK